MKRCPTCGRLYSDATLNFCLDDGGWLEPVDGAKTEILATPADSASGETKATAIFPAGTGTGGSGQSESLHSHTSPGRPDLSAPGHGFRYAALAVALFILAGAAGLVYWAGKGGDAATNKNTRPAPAADLTIKRLTGNGKVSRAAISPDGKFLAYVQKDGGQQSLWVKQVSTNSGVQVVAPALVDGYFGLVFPPDGEYIYFSGVNKDNPIGTIFRVPTLGGSIAKIVINAWDTTVSPDGKQLAFIRWNSDTAETTLLTVNADGTDERKLASLQGRRFLNGAFSWSPDGKLIACGLGDDDRPHPQTVMTVDVADGTMREFGEYKWDDIDSVVWLPDMSGVIFSADDTGGGEGVSKLWEMSYPSGESRRLTQDLADYSRITITGDGKTIVAVESESATNVWVSPNAEPALAKQITSGKDNAARGIAWTPDKRIVYVSMRSGNTEVWVMNSDGTDPKQLTNDGRIKYTPVVSPDGRYIVYGTSQGGGDLWRINVDGSSPIVLTGKGTDDANPDISPDSKWVVYSSWNAGKQELRKISIDGGDPTGLANFNATEPNISPDGKLVTCFYRDEKQKWRIAVLPFEGGEPVNTFEIPQTIEIDMSPKWMPDGRGITYVDSKGGLSNLWLLDYPAGTVKQVTDFKENGLHRREWTLDGKQVALVRGDSTNDVVMITNFK